MSQTFQPRVVPTLPTQVVPSGVVTREGVWWLISATVLLVAGWYKGINLILLLADLMLATVGLNALIGRKPFKHLSARRRAVGPVFARCPTTFDVEVKNLGPKAIQGWWIEWGDPHVAGAAFPGHPLTPGDSDWLRIEVTFPRRGRQACPPLAIASAFPFGLIRHRLVLDAPAEVLALPPLGSVKIDRFWRWLSISSRGDGRATTSARPTPASQADLHGLRPFRLGDSPRWVHWRTSARRNELMVREYEELPRHDLVIVLDPWREDRTSPTAEAEVSPGSPAALEAALSLVATLCHEICRTPGDRLVLAVAGPDDPQVMAGTSGSDLGWAMLDCLAAQNGSTELNEAALARSLVRVAPRSVPVMVVTTRGNSPIASRLAERFGRPVPLLDGLKPPEFYAPPPV